MGVLQVEGFRTICAQVKEDAVESLAIPWHTCRDVI